MIQTRIKKARGQEYYQKIKLKEYETEKMGD